MATMPTVGTLYQQGWPRRVSEASMMSSATRKKACSHSMAQPSTAARFASAGVAPPSLPPPALRCSSARMAFTACTTVSPRLSLPPGTLYSMSARVCACASAGSL